MQLKHIVMLGVGLLVLMVGMSINRARERAWGDRAKLTLRAMGSSALAEDSYSSGGVNRDAFAYGGEGAPPMAPSPEAGTDFSAIPTSSGGPGDGSGNIGRIQQSATDRFLIKNATAQLEAEDPQKAVTQLRPMVQQMGGYTGSGSDVVDSLGRHTVSLEIRLPSKEFDRLLGQLATIGKVLETHINSQDVTEEFVDAQASLRNLKATEARLLAHLATSKELKDTLLVEVELTRIRGEIERLEGRLRYLADRVDFSTVSLTIRPAAAAEPVVPVAAFSTSREVTAALRDVIGFLQNLWATMVWAGVWGIVWLPLLLIFLIIRRRRTARSRVASAT